MFRTLPFLLLFLPAALTAGWFPEERLTTRPDTGDFTTQNNARAIAADRAGNIHIVWHGKSGAQSQVRYSCRDVGTGEWSPDTVISSEPQGAYNPAIAADDTGNLHVIWQVGSVSAANALRYRHRDHATGFWHQVETADSGTGVSAPSIAARRPGFVAIAWEEQFLPGMYRHILTATRTDSGWGHIESVSGQGSYADNLASVGVDAVDRIGVTWQTSAGQGMILFRWRENDTWGRIETLHAGSTCRAPSLDVTQNGTTHAVWQARHPGGSSEHIIYRQRRSGTWGDTVAIFAPTLQVQPASVCADTYGAVHAVWCKSDRLFYATADSSGAAWSPACTLASSTTKKENPSVCAGPGADVQVVWTDFRHSTTYPDIYFRKRGLLRDIAVKRIESPAGAVDSGTVIWPAAWVANQGESTETEVRVSLRLDTTQDEQVIPVLTPGDSSRVEFNLFIPERRGWNPVACSTALSGDVNRTNDVVRDSFFVRVLDVSVDSILRPSGLVPADTVRPSALAHNRGNLSASVTLHFRITAGDSLRYTDTGIRNLAAGQRDSIFFASWFAMPGHYTASCSAAYAGDMRPENNVSRCSFEVFRRDIGVVSIEWPTAMIDSGTTGNPAYVVRNFGTTREDFSGFIRIGTDYRTSIAVSGLMPGQDTLLRFSDWQALKRGLHPVVCSVFCAGDVDPRNDLVRCTTFVAVRDVAAESILSPVGVIKDDTVRPRVRVTNPGNIAAQLLTCFRIESDSAGILYRDSVLLSLAPGATAETTFTLWHGATGRFRAVCSTAYPEDMRPENDAVETEFVLYRPDVHILELVWPSAVIDSGDRAKPCVRIANFGLLPAVVACSLIIGPYYCSESLFSLAPGDTQEFEFHPEYVAIQRGWQPVLCSIMSTSEPMRRARQGRPTEMARLPNASLRCSVFVRVADASAREIVRPRGPTGAGEVRPAALVANLGNHPADIPCRFRISDSVAVLYEDSTTVGVASESETYVEFAPWFATRGRYSACSWTDLDSDVNPANDTARASFTVGRVDAALKAILEPTGNIRPGSVLPRVRIANLGEQPADIRVRFDVSDSALVYADSVILFAVPAGTETTAVFPPWLAADGRYFLFARTVLEHDEDPTNDTTSIEVVVESLVVRCWSRLAALPRGADRRLVKEGGGVAAVEGGLFAVMGGGSDECWRYDVAGDSWYAVRPVPAGLSGRRVKSGGAVCSDGRGQVFVLRGNRTRDFFSYSPTGDSWTALSPVPAFTRLVKYGAGSGFVGRDTGSVYFVKGSGTREFLVYGFVGRQWRARRYLPSGPRGRVARRGTCVAALGTRVFCLKGGTAEFYEYFVRGDSWHGRADLPVTARGTRARDGAAMCSDGERFLYALKGRGDEFWRYDAASDVWERLEDVPRGGGARRVGAGAGLAMLGGMVYALKGNGSDELWRFEPGAAGAGPARSLSAVSDLSDARDMSDEDAGRRGARDVRVVYDAAGRRTVLGAERGGSGYRLSATARPGVYFVLEANRTTKVVILR